MDYSEKQELLYMDNKEPCDSYFESEDLGVMYSDIPVIVSDGGELVDKIVSLEDGFDITRNNWGYLNLEYWADITGYTVEQIIALANGKLMWREPKQVEMRADKTIGWVTREQILKGNRIQKLKEATEINKKYGQMDEVIDLLKANLPEEVAGEDIHVNMGSTWVLDIENFISEFIAELLDMTIPPKVIYDPYRGKWSIECMQEPNYVLNNFTYGTLQMDCLHIIEHKMNTKPIKVNDSVYNYETGKYDSVINKANTIAAQERGKASDVKFQDYCHGVKYNEDRLQIAFANRFGYGISRFDGSYLKLEDASKKIKLYQHQKDAVAHIMACHNVLLAHNVGSGKTYEYACGIHELMRLGLCKKGLIVVPNTTLDAAGKVYKDLFPMDNVMICRPRKEFAPANRKKTLDIIKEEENIVVFMAYSSFDMLTMTKKYAFAKKDAMLRECAMQIENAQSYSHKSKLKAMHKRMSKTVRAYKDRFVDNECAVFDELGFDAIVVDEAHNYKNISIDYSADNIVGMRCKGSKKADNMLEKVRYIQEGDGRVIFATGTPITNSLADLYTLMFYLQPEELKLCGIYHFNDWVSTFCEEEHSFEVDVDSKNCRFTTRFSRFHNLPELMAIFSEVCDFYQGDADILGLPDFNGYRDIVVKKSDEQKSYIDNLAERTEAIRNHEVNRKEDNLLKITVQGRQAALDIRLVKPEAVLVNSENKVQVCARNMARMYYAFSDKCQIAFSDISTPKDGFNIYDELKKELIRFGIKSDHVAYIHDAVSETQRSKMEKMFNDGKIRILIGSTAKLGTGSNVQERLLAVHHLDVPWRPADMVQREGRIIRQGNCCEEVYIYRYITESSFDAYTYQILENKQKFIAQFLSGSLSAVHRDESDCADTILTYAEIKALAIGNPLIKERVEISNQLEHARINQRQKRKELVDLTELQERLPEMITKRRLLISNTIADIAYYKSHKESVKKDERKSFGEELLHALKENVMHEKERLFCEYQGFDVILPRYMEYDKAYVIVKRTGSNQYTVSMDGDKVLGVCQRLDYCLDNFGKELERHKNKLRNLIAQQNQTKRDLETGNIYDDEVAALADKLMSIDEKLKEDTAA